MLAENSTDDFAVDSISPINNSEFKEGQYIGHKNRQTMNNS